MSQPLHTLQPLGSHIPIDIEFRLLGAQQVMTGFQQVMRVAYDLRSVVTQASITTYVFAMLMRRQSQTARSLKTAQENANEAIQRYGRYSLEATQALRRLEQAEENAKFAQVEFALQTVYATMSIISMLPMIRRLITDLGVLMGAYYGVAIAKMAAFGAVGVLGVLGGIAIGSIVFGGGAKTEPTFEEEWARAGGRVKRELARYGRR